MMSIVTKSLTGQSNNVLSDASFTSRSAPAGLSRRRLLSGLAIGAVAPQLFATAAFAQDAAQNPNQMPPARKEPVQKNVRAILQQYGSFAQSDAYGEIWIPGPQTAPQGWHPYPPCHWVRTKKYGWYFDDKTPWGAIVHHYGRWAHDSTTGWFWVPGAEFSPGWVLWRTSPAYIGWAPMPPDQDMQNAQAASLDTADSWLFMDVAKFGGACEGGALPASSYPVILRDTKFVSQIEFVDGIAIFVLPVYVVGPYVDIIVVFEPWPVWFFTQIIIYWNWIWHHILLINVQIKCLP